LWRGLSLGKITSIFLGDIFSADTILLVCLMSLIMVFSSGMKKAGAMDAFARSIIASPPRDVCHRLGSMLIGTCPYLAGPSFPPPVESMDSEGHMSRKDYPREFLFQTHHRTSLALFPAFVMTLSCRNLHHKLFSIHFYSAPVLFTWPDISIA